VDATIAIAPDAVSRVFEGRASIISLDEGRIRTLNETATILWSALVKTPARVDALVDLLAARFPSRSRAALEADALAFVSDLVARNLARVVG
jgi:hypothetical protein